MKEKYIIKNYCIIRNQSVILDDHLIFIDQDEDSFSDFSKKIYKHFKLNYPKFFKMDSLSKLGFLTCELLLNESSFIPEKHSAETGLILQNAASSMDTDINHQTTISNRNDYFPSPAVFVYTLPNIMIGEICIKHRITGESSFFVSEKFDADFIYTYVKLLFDQKIISYCIIGWVDLIGDSYESFLCLIKKKGENEDDYQGNIIFDAENLNKLFVKQF